MTPHTGIKRTLDSILRFSPVPSAPAAVSRLIRTLNFTRRFFTLGIVRKTAMPPLVKTSFLLGIAAFGALSAFVRCASVSRPLGGPVDSLPPVVIGAIPPEYSTGFDAKKIVIEFNEYVNLRDQQKEFIMSPQPERKPLITSDGRSIVIKLEDPLEPNTTYRLDFGNSIVDNNESNKLQGYAYTFSTGSAIDSLVMGGQLLDAYTRDTLVGGFVFFFDARADSLPLDSLLFNARADAIFRADSSGLFIANTLKDKEYRIYAIIDKNGNQKYEPGTDLVGLLPGAYNPTAMPAFDIEAVEGPRGGLRLRMNPPQIIFETFMEEPVRRQTLLDRKRPYRQQVQLLFAAPHPEITEFRLDGIDPSWLRRDDGTKGDTISYWIVPPSETLTRALPDTLRGVMTFTGLDSLSQPVPMQEKILTVWREPDRNARDARKAEKEALKEKKGPGPKKIAARKKKVQRKLAKLRATEAKYGWLTFNETYRLEKLQYDSLTLFGMPKFDSLLTSGAELDSATLALARIAQSGGEIRRDAATDPLEANKNPFKYSVKADNPLNPEAGITITLPEAPILTLHSERIVLRKLVPPKVEYLADGTKAPLIEQRTPFRVETDTTVIKRNIRIVAEWEPGAKYRLLIPDSTITDIAYYCNDTLKSEFTVAMADKYGTLNITFPGTADSSRTYIAELLNTSKKPERIRTGFHPGDQWTVSYLAPGNYTLRIIEDLNGNGRWDGGSLTERRMPERVRLWEHPINGPVIVARENWQVEIPVDGAALFPAAGTTTPEAPCCAHSHEKGHEHPANEPAETPNDNDHAQ